MTATVLLDTAGVEAWSARRPSTDVLAVMEVLHRAADSRVLLPCVVAVEALGGRRGPVVVWTAVDTGRQAVGRECVEVEWHDWHATIRMALPERRNALSEQHMRELVEAFEEVADTDLRGIVLAGDGPVFSAGHDFADMADRDLGEMRRLLQVCTDLMLTMQSVPQVVLARVHGLATAAGCQLVASADLAVAAESAGFATPGGRGGWFCHTPMVAVARAIPRKRAVEMGFTGDVIDAATAAQWGLVNRVVPDDQLDEACLELLERATRGSRSSKAMGKQALYHQMGLSQQDAYAHAMEVMAASSQTADGQEAMASFVEKRRPEWTHE